VTSYRGRRGGKPISTTVLDFVEVDGDQPAATDRPLTDHQIVAALAVSDFPEIPTRAASVHSAFQSAVLKVAVGRLRLLAKVDPDPRKSTPGFPDLGLVGPGGLLFIELKVDRIDSGRAPRFEAAQPVWIRALTAIAEMTDQRVRCTVRTPADWYPGGPIVQDLAFISRPPTRTRPLTLPTDPLRGRTLR
jgi:hypothetical protein